MGNIYIRASKMNISEMLGRVCALIGYITGDTCPTEHEKLVFEMVTGEKLEECGVEET